MFDKFRVPRDNLLVPKTGDGLTIAYHGLNRAGWLCARSLGRHARVPREPSAVDLLPANPTASPSRCAAGQAVSPGWRR